VHADFAAAWPVPPQAPQRKMAARKRKSVVPRRPIGRADTVASRVTCMTDMHAMQENFAAERAAGVALPAAIVARIARRLQQARLAHWTAVACDWAARFDGLQEWIGAPRDAPAHALLRLAGRYARRPHPRTDAAVAAALTWLPFTCWQARWPAWAADRPQRWNPLICPFRAFVQQRTDADTSLVVWESAKPAVPADTAIAFLLARLRLRTPPGS
jgi:hypothetical protein